MRIRIDYLANIDAETVEAFGRKVKEPTEANLVEFILARGVMDLEELKYETVPIEQGRREPVGDSEGTYQGSLHGAGTG